VWPTSKCKEGETEQGALASGRSGRPCKAHLEVSQTPNQAGSFWNSTENSSLGTPFGSGLQHESTWSDRVVVETGSCVHGLPNQANGVKRGIA